MLVLSIAIWFCIGLLIKYSAIKLAWKLDFLNYPTQKVKHHKNPVAYLGGLSIFLTIIINFWAGSVFYDYNFFDNETFKTLIVLGLFMFLGTIDDKYILSAKNKFFLQMGASALTVYLGFYVEIFPIPILNYVCSGFALLCLLNAFNLIDVSDGLLTSVFLPTMLYFYFMIGQNPLELIIVISFISFLYFNRPDAKIYLGDGGSHLLGAVAFVYFIKLFDSNLFIGNTLIDFMLISVILFEFFFLLYRRTKQGLSIFKASPDHYAMLLMLQGWSKTKIALISMLTSTVFVLAAYFSQSSSLTFQLVIFALVLGFFFVIGYVINSKFRLKN